MLCAEEAGDSRAYVLSAQAKTARWQGARQGGRAGSPFFARSADLARQGFELSPDAPVRVLLANQEASASALLPYVARARRALRDARDAAASPQAADSGLSTWSCPGSWQALYALSVAIRLRDPDEALRAAEMADAGWAAGDPWLYGVWALIRIGAGIAYVMKGDLDAACGQLDAVLTLAPGFRIATITSYLADKDSLLRQRRFAGADKARDLRQQIAAFTTAASPATAGGGAGLVSPFPVRMEDHWLLHRDVDRGRARLMWLMLVGDCPPVVEVARLGQARLAGLGGLDLVPQQWLHVTTLIAGFADEITPEQVGVMAGEARLLLARTPPVTITLGRVLYHPRAIMLGVGPPGVLIRSARCPAGYPCRHQMRRRTVHRAWIPHVTLAYSNAAGPAGTGDRGTGARAAQPGKLS